MKRTIVILTISATLLVAGILYGGYELTEYRKILNLDEAYTQFPEPFSNVVIDPMCGFPVY